MEGQKRYGYIRVSSRDQNEDRQRIVLQEMDVSEKNIFMDKQSGKDTEISKTYELSKKLVHIGKPRELSSA